MNDKTFLSLQRLLTIDEIAAKYGLDRNVVLEIARWGVDYMNRKWHLRCAICDAELTEEEMKYADPLAAHKGCTKHRELARYFQNDIAREQAGYPPYRPFET